MSKKTYWICAIVIIILLFLVGLVCFLWSEDKSVERFSFSREHGVNYFEDELYYNRALQYAGRSYYQTDDFIYTYGYTGFTIVDLHTGDIRILLNKSMNKESRELYELYSKEKRTKEGLDKPYLILLTDESLLTEKELSIKKRLEIEVYEYPHKSIFIGLSLKE